MGARKLFVHDGSLGVILHYHVRKFGWEQRCVRDGFRFMDTAGWIANQTDGCAASLMMVQRAPQQ